MINATSTFVDDSDHKIVEADSILQKFYKRAIASVNEFTYINTVKAVADEVLFNRVLMSLGVERCNNSSNCLGGMRVTTSSIQRPIIISHLHRRGKD
jgi:hypothetical protein